MKKLFFSLLVLCTNVLAQTPSDIIIIPPYVPEQTTWFGSSFLTLTLVLANVLALFLLLNIYKKLWQEHARKNL